MGRYWRSKPLVFSQVPRCHGLCGSQKYTATPEERQAYKGLTLESAYVISSVHWGDEMVGGFKSQVQRA